MTTRNDLRWIAGSPYDRNWILTMPMYTPFSPDICLSRWPLKGTTVRFVYEINR